MSTYTATIRWQRGADEGFAKGQYSRAHEWAFDGGHVMPASASPHIVPDPWGNPAGVDPEEAFVASLAACHMLWFLDHCRRERLRVSSYADDAVGELDGVRITRVELRPRIEFGAAVEPATIAALHERAHRDCFLANSVSCPVEVVA